MTTIVVTHTLIIITISQILMTGKPYEQLGAGYFTSRLDPSGNRLFIAKFEALGTVTHQPAA